MSDPRARLMSGDAWERLKTPALAALLLPAQPAGLLDEHSATLDAAWRRVSGGLASRPEITIDVPKVSQSRISSAAHRGCTISMTVLSGQ